VRRRGWLAPRSLGALPAAGLALATAFLLAQPAAAATTTAAQVATFGRPVAGSPLFVSFTNTFDQDISTTVFTVVAQSSDGSPLGYRWTLSAPCGTLTAPGADQPSNGYFHGPTAQQPNGCPPPPGAEILTTVTVDVFRASDADPATHAPKAGAPYFTYVMSARAQDEQATAGFPTNAQLDYNGTPPAPTQTPTATPTTTPVTAATTPVASTGGPPWWIAVLVLVVVVIAIAAWIATHRPVMTVETPPLEKCAREKADLASAEEAEKAARAKFAPIDAAQKKLSAARLAADSTREESERLDKAAGATKHTDSGSNSEGVSFTRVHWNYKYPSGKEAAEKARGAAEAAAKALEEAQKSFDGMGGWSAWNEAHNALTAAENALKAAQDALAKCMGVAAPVPPAVGGTTTDGGTTTGGGVTPPVDPPKTQEKPGCKEGESKTTEICRGTVSENSIGSLKLLPSGWFESGDSVRDILNKFRQVDAAIDMASKVKDAFTNPVGSIVDSIQRAGQMMNKLPPSPPGSYQDAMKGALSDGIEDLTHKLDTFHGQISTLQAAWPVNTYEYVGTLTCTCQGGKVVASRSFTVTHKSGPTVQVKELTSGGASGMITADDVGRMTGILLRQLVAQNNSAEKTLYDMQKKLDDAACGA
jgi:hypothetical protein